MADGGRPHVLVIDHVAPMTRLLEKRRQMFEVQEALDAQKEEFARREEAARRREEELRKKDLDLQTSLIHYNKTITANEDKRQRALQRIQQESRAVSKKEAEIAELVARIRKDEAEQDERLQAIARVQQFHDYLQAVQLSHAEEFGEIPLIQRRFETLQRTNGQLRQRNEELEGELRRARQELERARSREITERLAQTLTATDMTGHFEGLVEDTEALSRREAEAAVGEHRRVSEFGVVLASVGNLFGRASRSGAGQRIRHFDDEAVAKEVLTSAQEVAEKEGTTLEALAPFMGASGAEAAAPGAASAGATSESKTAGRGAGAAAAAAAAAAAGSATATSAATGAAAAVSAAGDTADPAALKRMRRLAARAELTQATVLASARLTAVGAWVSDFSELAAAWARDERAMSTPPVVVDPYLESTQRRYWLFSEHELQRVRDATYARAQHCRNLALAEFGPPADAPGDEPSASKRPRLAAEERLLCRHWELKTLAAGAMAGLPRSMTATAIVYQKRFWLSASPIEMSPADVLAAALFLAVKVEGDPYLEVPELHRRLGDTLGKAPEQMAAREADLMLALRFHLTLAAACLMLAAEHHPDIAAASSAREHLRRLGELVLAAAASLDLASAARALDRRRRATISPAFADEGAGAAAKKAAKRSLEAERQKAKAS
ncbi:hypothetical protein FNF28_05005 [Cafeteria roenbergensis]|uniref:DUF4200 domain-containing protein n=1 Tax=Cafeteria roenbergensis TaxID=33653 RepID=A0A5A8D8P7_CAFRO|nr:hypothetical protein FNF28_05005 [Cafeteria roenbergensis]